MKAGRISEQGSYSELLANKGAFADFLVEYMAKEPDEVDDEVLVNIKSKLEETMGEENFKKEFMRQVWLYIIILCVCKV